MKTLQAEMLDLKSIEVLDFVDREEMPTEDERLSRSIRSGGIQEPLIVVRDKGQTLLVKGSRRRRIALSLGIPKARCVIDQVPDGMTAESYIRRVRFILHEHRQDLIPSVRAGLIVKLKEQLGLKNKQVAAYLGIDPDTITNWLEVLRFVPEVVAAIDTGALRMDAARAFNGMTDEGQKAVWKKHKDELIGSGRKGAHKRIRNLYSPTKYPAFYHKPDKIAARLNRAKKKRTTRVSYTAAEKQRLLASVEVKEAELAEFTTEAQALKRQCNAAGPLVAAILRQRNLRALVSKEMLPELERFAEVYT